MTFTWSLTRLLFFVSVVKVTLATNTYLGCFQDVSSEPTMKEVLYSDEMTVEYCIQLCKDEGRLYAGLKDGTRCNCGINYALYGWYPERECDQECGGDSTETCGGYSSNSVYDTTEISSYPSLGGKVGLENGDIADNQLTCSSVYDNTKNTVPNCRLNAETDGWAPLYEDDNSWLQVDLLETKRVSAIMTQGSGISTNRKWIYTFKVAYSNNGYNWTFHQTYANHSYQEQIFYGHDEHTQQTVLTHAFDVVMVTRYVRIYPLTCEWSCNLRLEILTIDALGMESSTITDEQLSSSSTFNDDFVNYGATNARLNMTVGAGYWSPDNTTAQTDAGDFLEIDLRGRTVVRQIATQGGGNGNVTGFVKTYKVAYFLEKSTEEFWVTDNNDTMEEQFNCTSDDVTVHTFNQPIFARILKIYPTSWSGFVALRIEVYGYVPAMTSCYAWHSAGYPMEMSYWIDPDGENGANSYPVYCRGAYNALGMTTGYITDDYISQSDPNDGEDFAAVTGRLYYEDPLGSLDSPAWIPDSPDNEDWMEITLRYYAIVRVIATQGRDGLDEWVQSYYLLYQTVYDNDLVSYRENGEIKIFIANTDPYNVVEHVLQTPLWMVRRVRLRPQTWNGQIAMKVELYGEYINHPAFSENLSLGKTAYQSQVKKRWVAEFAIDGNPDNDMYEDSCMHTGQDSYPWWLVDLGETYDIMSVSAVSRGDSHKRYISYLEARVGMNSYENSEFTGNTLCGPVMVGPYNGGETADFDCGGALTGRYVSIQMDVASNAYLQMCEVYVFAYYDVDAAIDVEVCSEALGMENERIKYYQITASSSLDGYHPFHGRLYNSVGLTWAADEQNSEQFIQIDLLAFTTVRKIATQGFRHTDTYGQFYEWRVTSYMVEYSVNDMQYDTYFSSTNSAKVFLANVNDTHVVENDLSPSVFTRFLKIRPQTWLNRIAMKIELYGCYTAMSSCNTWYINNYTLPGWYWIDSTGGDSVDVYPDYCQLIQRESAINVAVNGTSTQKGNLTVSQYAVDGDYSSVDVNDGRCSSTGETSNPWWLLELEEEFTIERIAVVGTYDGDCIAEVDPQSCLFLQNSTYIYFGSDMDSEINPVCERPTDSLLSSSPYIDIDCGGALTGRYLRIQTYRSNWHLDLCEVMLYPIETTVEQWTDVLGMESGEIEDRHITASSEISDNFGAAKARLNSDIAWTAQFVNADQWLQVDLFSLTYVTKVAIQCGEDGAHSKACVTRFYILHGHDEDSLLILEDSNGNKIFSGTEDSEDTVYHQLSSAVFTRYIRFQSLTWNYWISMRLELYGRYQAMKSCNAWKETNLHNSSNRFWIDDDDGRTKSVRHSSYCCYEHEILGVYDNSRTVLTSSSVFNAHSSAQHARITSYSQAGPECYSCYDGSDYRGVVSHTVNNLQCLIWSETSYIVNDESGSGLGEHNYCRNPNNEARPWCFVGTMFDSTGWQYCDVGQPATTCGKDCLTDFMAESVPSFKEIATTNQTTISFNLRVFNDTFIGFSANQNDIDYVYGVNILVGQPASIDLIRTKDGVNSILATAAGSYQNNTWQQFWLSLHDGKLALGTVEGQTLIEYQDSQQIPVNYVMYGTTRRSGDIHLCVSEGCWRPYVERIETPAISLNTTANASLGQETENHWIQATLQAPAHVSKVEMRGDVGCSSARVLRYRVDYSIDGQDYEWYKEQGEIKDIFGTTYPHVNHIYEFNDPIFARFVRIHPLKMEQYFCLRLELHGCYEVLKSCDKWLHRGYPYQSYWVGMETNKTLEYCGKPQLQNSQR
ncbi:uncharacterized protein [Ptychodera flava]|uniref:uncharacterized protein n=1 Tax=Ptychodera flava TaxID=63121 RepID=UPI00396A39FE